MIYGIPSLINFLLVRFVYTNERVKGEMIFSKSVSKIIEGTERMCVETYNLLPKYIFIIAIVIVCLIILYKIIRHTNKIHKKILKLLEVFYILFVTWTVTVAPQLLQDTNSIWFVARSSYSMATVIGLLILYLFMKFNINRIEEKFVIIALTLFLIVQYSNFMRYAIDNYIGNYMDKTVSLEINRMIQEYEERTENKVDSISIYKDSAMQYVYPQLKASGDINVKAYTADWCITGILKLYTNRELKVVENDLSKKEQFLQKNWDCFSEEQVVFENNVLHLCVF